MTLERKYRSLSKADSNKIFGSYKYKSRKNGTVIPDPKWVAENIVPVTLVGGNKGKDVKTYCHRLAKEPFEAAYEDLRSKGLSETIGFSGLYVPRHKLWNINNGLSNHSLGTSVDINDATNPFGGKADAINTAIAPSFINNGFDWGDFWKQPYRDPMHFELVDPQAYLNSKKPIKKEPRLILAVSRENKVSYYQVNAKLERGNFTALPVEVSKYLGGAQIIKPNATPVKVRDTVAACGYKVFKVEDLSKDLNDPRVYLFVTK